MKELLHVITFGLIGASIGVVTTKLTSVGDTIGFKPFNCFVCLSLWAGFLLSVLSNEYGYFNGFVYHIGSGFLASIFAYFLIDRIYR